MSFKQALWPRSCRGLELLYSTTLLCPPPVNGTKDPPSCALSFEGLWPGPVLGQLGSESLRQDKTGPSSWTFYLVHYGQPSVLCMVAVFNQVQFSSPGDIWWCLEITGLLWVKARDAAKHVPQCTWECHKEHRAQSARLEKSWCTCRRARPSSMVPNWITSGKWRDRAYHPVHIVVFGSLSGHPPSPVTFGPHVYENLGDNPSGMGSRNFQLSNSVHSSQLQLACGVQGGWRLSRQPEVSLFFSPVSDGKPAVLLRM